MGFGTEQEYVASKDWMRSLNAGDIILILFYQNDFYDVLRRRFALRAKPFFEKVGSEYVLHAPEIGLRDRLRDVSYIASLVGRAMEPLDSAMWDINEGVRIIRSTLTRIRRESPEGVKLALAHHGEGDALAAVSGVSGRIFCEHVDICVDLDSHLGGNSANFLPDRHWTKLGHAVVRLSLRKALFE